MWAEIGRHTVLFLSSIGRIDVDDQLSPRQRMVLPAKQDSTTDLRSSLSRLRCDTRVADVVSAFLFNRIGQGWLVLIVTKQSLQVLEDNSAHPMGCSLDGCRLYHARIRRLQYRRSRHPDRKRRAPSLWPVSLHTYSVGLDNSPF